jgi:HEAT repeat protein
MPGDTGHRPPAAIDSLIVLLPDSRPFIRTIAISELGRLQAVAALPGMLKAVRDKQPLVRSTSLRALTRIGAATADVSPLVVAMLAALDNVPHEESVVREAALDGLGALAPKVTTQRPEIIRALTRTTADRNPRLAGKARELLRTAYREPAG